MVGTDTQIRWGTEEYVRRRQEWDVLRASLDRSYDLDRLDRLADILFAITKASYWIRHRHETLAVMLEKLEDRLYASAS